MGVLLAVGLAFAWLGGGRRRSAPAMVATASTERLPTLATNPSAPPPLRSIGSLVTTTGSAAPPPSLAVAAAAYAIGDYATALEHYAALAQSEPSPLYATVTKVLTRKLAATPEGRVRR